MKNIEKYEEEINEAINDRFVEDILCEINENIMGERPLVDCCYSGSEMCEDCQKNVMKWLLKEYEEPIKPILTEKEKIIINNILKAIEPFGAEVQCIAKYRQGDEPTDYYLNFSYKNSIDSFDTLAFNGNELFVGMEVDELYTLKELGLWKISKNMKKK